VETIPGPAAARIPWIARIGKGWSLAPAGILDRIGAFPRAGWIGVTGVTQWFFRRGLSNLSPRPLKSGTET